MSASGQLPLPFMSGRRLGETDFRLAASNAEAAALLRRTADWPDRRLVLWGEQGCGKTHLLHIWMARTGAVLRPGPLLSGLPEMPPAGGIAIDEADVVVDERALLHLVNGAAEAGLPVLLAARTPPSRWVVGLPDLASRMRATMAVQVGPPEDSLLRAVLARLLDEHGLRVAESLQFWLLSRLPRSAAALGEAVERLDAASLDVHRDVTVRFARSVLADLLAPDA